MRTELWFDMDGTLVDVRQRLEEVHRSIRLALNEGSTEAIWPLRCEGLSTPEVLSRVGVRSVARYVELHHERLEAPQMLALDNLRPGVRSVLENLSDQAHLGLLAGRTDREALLAQLEALGVREFFFAVETVSQRWTSADKAAVLQRRSAAVAYCGDTRKDVDAAHLAGKKALGVTGGIAQPGDLRSADLVVDSWPAAVEPLKRWLAS